MSLAHAFSSHTPSQLRRQTRPQMDTPTPAPSSGHTSTLITSLKPSRSHSNLSADLRDGRSSKPSFNPRPSSQQHRPPLGHSLGRGLNLPVDLDTGDLDLDHLEIATDGTERQRRTLEEEIRRGMDALERQSSASEASVGFGDLSDVEKREGGARDFRARIEDETVSGSSSDSLGDDFSLQIGMAGRRGSEEERPQPVNHAGGNGEEQEEHGSLEIDGDLTYLSLSRSISPVSPRRFATGLRAAPAAVPSTGAARTSGMGGAGGQDAARRVFGDAENVPSPRSVAAEPKKASSSNQQQQQPSSSRAPFPSSIRRDLPATSSPLNSSSALPSPASRPLRAPTTSRTTGLASFAAQNSYQREQSYDLPNESTRMRLPDITGLTEGLQSPLKTRGHYAVAEGAAASEGVALSTALDQLRRRLAGLERENSMSASRVRELEERLSNEVEQPKTSRAAAAEPGISGDEWSRRLQEEQEKRTALEALVNRLRTHVTHLSHSLESHATTLATLRSAPPPPAPTAGLEEEVTALRTGLDGLGKEVEAVRGVVEELVREREGAKEWEREEEERRKGMERERPARREEVRREDPERTPRAKKAAGWKWTGPETPREGRSFIDGEEIERLRAELAQEEARRSPTPRAQRVKVSKPTQTDNFAPCTRQHYDHPPSRPSTAPLPAQRQKAPVHRQHSYESYDAVRPLPERRTAPIIIDEADLETSFARAEEIFRSVSAPKVDATPAAGGMCSVCRRRKRGGEPGSAPARMGREDGFEGDDEGVRAEGRKERREDPQMALVKVLRDLEEDFEQHKRIYIELSEQYRAMDSKVGGGKRRALADHLKESIDTLELKADQVKRLHDLLHYNPSTNAAPVSSPSRPATREFGAGRMREGII